MSFATPETCHGCHQSHGELVSCARCNAPFHSNECLVNGDDHHLWSCKAQSKLAAAVGAALSVGDPLIRAVECIDNENPDVAAVVACLRTMPIHELTRAMIERDAPSPPRSPTVTLWKKVSKALSEGGIGLDEPPERARPEIYFTADTTGHPFSLSGGSPARLWQVAKGPTSAFQLAHWAASEGQLAGLVSELTEGRDQPMNDAAPMDAARELRRFIMDGPTGETGSSALKFNAPGDYYDGIRGDSGLLVAISSDDDDDDDMPLTYAAHEQVATTSNQSQYVYALTAPKYPVALSGRKKPKYTTEDFTTGELRKLANSDQAKSAHDKAEGVLTARILRYSQQGLAGYGSNTRGGSQVYMFWSGVTASKMTPALAKATQMTQGGGTANFKGYLMCYCYLLFNNDLFLVGARFAREIKRPNTTYDAESEAASTRRRRAQNERLAKLRALSFTEWYNTVVAGSILDRGFRGEYGDDTTPPFYRTRVMAYLMYLDNILAMDSHGKYNAAVWYTDVLQAYRTGFPGDSPVRLPRGFPTKILVSPAGEEGDVRPYTLTLSVSAEPMKTLAAGGDHGRLWPPLELIGPTCTAITISHLATVTKSIRTPSQMLFLSVLPRLQFLSIQTPDPVRRIGVPAALTSLTLCRSPGEGYLPLTIPVNDMAVLSNVTVLNLTRVHMSPELIAGLGNLRALEKLSICETSMIRQGVRSVYLVQEDLPVLFAALPPRTTVTIGRDMVVNPAFLCGPAVIPDGLGLVKYYSANPAAEAIPDECRSKLLAIPFADTVSSSRSRAAPASVAPPMVVLDIDATGQSSTIPSAGQAAGAQGKNATKRKKKRKKKKKKKTKKPPTIIISDDEDDEEEAVVPLDEANEVAAMAADSAGEAVEFRLTIQAGPPDGFVGIEMQGDHPLLVMGNIVEDADPSTGRRHTVVHARVGIPSGGVMTADSLFTESLGGFNAAASARLSQVPEESRFLVAPGGLTEPFPQIQGMSSETRFALTFATGNRDYTGVTTLPFSVAEMRANGAVQVNAAGGGHFMSAPVPLNLVDDTLQPEVRVFFFVPMFGLPIITGVHLLLSKESSRSADSRGFGGAPDVYEDPGEEGVALTLRNTGEPPSWFNVHRQGGESLVNATDNEIRAMHGLWVNSVISTVSFDMHLNMGGVNAALASATPLANQEGSNFVVRDTVLDTPTSEELPFTRRQVTTAHPTVPGTMPENWTRLVEAFNTPAVLMDPVVAQVAREHNAGEITIPRTLDANHDPLAMISVRLAGVDGSLDFSPVSTFPDAPQLYRSMGVPQSRAITPMALPGGTDMIQIARLSRAEHPGHDGAPPFSWAYCTVTQTQRLIGDLTSAAVQLEVAASHSDLMRIIGARFASYHAIVSGGDMATRFGVRELAPTPNSPTGLAYQAIASILQEVLAMASTSTPSTREMDGQQRDTEMAYRDEDTARRRITALYFIAMCVDAAARSEYVSGGTPLSDGYTQVLDQLAPALAWVVRYIPFQYYVPGELSVLRPAQMAVDGSEQAFLGSGGGTIRDREEMEAEEEEEEPPQQGTPAFSSGVPDAMDEDDEDVEQRGGFGADDDDDDDEEDAQPAVRRMPPSDDEFSAGGGGGKFGRFY